ncbi:hypothetical protein [Lentilactobacillus hilgardii]|uniref:hypothetical protein n=1 Tax=Lentilactobacillus hilgardii TaxID=1588 RepID=UPI0021A50F2B|nr:hypothetical protein [Lentilactobacillus hilgardii]MCT3398496.1 hypothetical protein [Lentilactobacillus hilgardii]
MNNKRFDMDIVNTFFEHDYYDRGMIKWQGFFLSDHTAALNKQKSKFNQEYNYKQQQSLQVITSILASAYNNHQEVTIQLKELDQNNINLPNITTRIYGYNANDIIIDSNNFIAIDDIRHIEFKNKSTKISY